MSRIHGSTTRTMQTGSVAVELALILPIMFVLMFAMFQFGRIFWQYNTVQKAAGDAARLLASMPPSDMQNQVTVDTAKAKAQQMIVDAAGEASITPMPIPSNVAVFLYCGASSNSICTYSPSATNRVTRATVGFDFTLTDDGFYDFGLGWSASVTNMTFHAESSMPVTN